VSDELPFELIVLGAGPAYSDRRGSVGASYFLRHGDAVLALDLGQGSFPGLASTVEPADLRAIVVSHLHPDHFIDLVALRHYLRWEFQPPRRVRVLAPAGLAGRLDALHAEPGWTAQALDVEDLSVGAHEVGPFSIEAGLVTHTDESYGFRVSIRGGTGPGLVYSGDCGRASDLVPLIRTGDWLLVECSFGVGPVAPGAEHLDAGAIADLAAATMPGRILLTHIQMGHDPAIAAERVRGSYRGPVDVVAPGSRFTPNL
jgi:ribonuclease BN (tRNA processing enzyme)